MNKKLFFVAASRLGLQHAPMGSYDRNIGVENGGSIILSSPTKIFHFPQPEDVSEKTYYKTIIDLYRKAATEITNSVDASDTLILLGGDHSVGVISLLSLLDRYRPEEIGHIQIDSHTDINTRKSSSTGNFHGMWLRPFIGDFDIPEITVYVPHTLPSSNVMYIGNLNCDPEEIRFLQSNNIRIVSLLDLKNQKKTITFFQNFLTTIKHLHISIDIDAFDKTIAPATGIPAEIGLLFEDISSILSLFSKFPSLSVDLVEFNPEKRGAMKTKLLASKLLATTV